MEYNIGHYFFPTHENELFSKDLDPFYYDTEFIEHTKHKCRFLQQQTDEVPLQAAGAGCGHPASLPEMAKGPGPRPRPPLAQLPPLPGGFQEPLAGLGAQDVFISELRL